MPDSSWNLEHFPKTGGIVSTRNFVMTHNRNMKTALQIAVLLSPLIGPLAGAGPLECTDWQTRHPEWIWCDDFESDAALGNSYFEVNRSNNFGVTTSGGAYGGNGALMATFLPGTEEAGNVKLGFGRSPVASKLATGRDFQEVYWRVYTKTSANWVGQPNKLTRATIFSGSNWSQAAISHLWEDRLDGLGLGLDPVSGVSGSQVVTTRYNDFSNLRWLGKVNGTTQIYAPENRERWTCVEVRMKLNTPGAADGVAAFWVDSKLEAQRTDLDFRGSYSGYGINAIMLENYKNGGFTQSQSRYYDNFVVSTSRIGCGSVRPNAPTNVKAE